MGFVLQVEPMFIFHFSVYDSFRVMFMFVFHLCYSAAFTDMVYCHFIFSKETYLQSSAYTILVLLLWTVFIFIYLFCLFSPLRRLFPFVFLHVHFKLAYGLFLLVVSFNNFCVSL